MNGQRARLYALSACALIAGTACAGAGIATPQTAASAVRRAPAPSGNIYWNKRHVRLQYAPRSHGRALLTYWGPDGYFTTGVACKRGGRVTATPRRHRGNGSGYVTVVYWFTARTPGPDTCGFSAILGGTGSPPVAPITLDIERG